MDKKQFLESGLLEQYVLGLTSDEESMEVERYAEAFPEIKAEIESLRGTVEEYARQYSIPPPSGLKSKILSNIEDSSQTNNPIITSTNKSIYWFSRLAIAAMLVLGFFCFRLNQAKNSLKTEVATQQTAFQQLEQQCEENRDKQQETERIIAFLKDGKTLPVRLQGTALAPEAVAVVFWNENEKNALLNVVNLPAPPSDKQYQIWADVEGEMINMGIFEADPTDMQKVVFIENAESLNITLEPRGGSEHPTVEFLFANGKV